MKTQVTLDCGCVVGDCDFGWVDCPNGHGRQRLRRLADDGVLARHVERRARFVAMHGVRVIPEG